MEGEDDERPRKQQKLDPDLNASLPQVPNSPHPTDSPKPQSTPPPPSRSTSPKPPSTTASSPKLSKNQQKKLRRKLVWEEGREWRKERRKEKTQAKKGRKREARAAAQEEVTNGEVRLDKAGTSAEASINPATASTEGAATPLTDVTIAPTGNRVVPPSTTPRTATLQPTRRPTYVPIAIILDCNFESLMTDQERVSLSSQITRSYSDIRRSSIRPSLVVSGFTGALETRFSTILNATHKNWKYVTFTGAGLEHGLSAARERISHAGSADAPETVYLTAESDDTLTELRENGTYIVGGLVDRNRHKGVCQAKAEGMGVRTAKLPIGEYMKMSSRFVLTTNHVVEIMVKWLQYRDWGRAFVEVLPARKGGTLKGEEAARKVEVEDAA